MHRRVAARCCSTCIRRCRLRNSGSRRIRGITLLVSAQDVTPGGKASVSVPSLNAAPGENFPIRIDLRLLRPLQAGNGPLVEIGLDGVLFDDLSFYGPNKLNSRRSMTVWEMEARRDRQYFKQVLESRGREGLKSEMLASLDHQADRSAMDARVAQSGRATTTRNERQIQVAFLEAPSAPVAAYDGMVRIADNEARSPRLFVRNTTSRPVRALEMGWVVKDDRGREFVAGSIPVDVPLAPRQKTTLVQDVTFKFTQAGRRADRYRRYEGVPQQCRVRRRDDVGTGSLRENADTFPGGAAAHRSLPQEGSRSPGRRVEALLDDSTSAWNTRV